MTAGDHLLGVDLGRRAGTPPPKPPVSAATRALVRAQLDAEHAAAATDRAGIAATSPVIDQAAEEAVAGIAALTAAGCRRVRDAVPAGDFFDSRCWAVIEAAADLDATDWTVDELLERGSIDRRVDHIAAVTGLDRHWVARLADRAPVLHDTSGSWSARVRAAADHRRHAMDLVGQLEGLGLALVVRIPPHPHGAAA